jgi:hypothetical protein
MKELNKRQVLDIENDRNVLLREQNSKSKFLNWRFLLFVGIGLFLGLLLVSFIYGRLTIKSNASESLHATTLNIPKSILTRYNVDYVENDGMVFFMLSPKTNNSLGSLSAASIGFKVGSLSDSFPGEAHLLEHSVFLTKDNLMKYVTSQGGLSNAYTGSDMTHYFFEVTQQKFTEVFERYIQATMNFNPTD